MTVVYGTPGTDSVADVNGTYNLIKTFAADAKMESIVGQEGTFTLSYTHRPVYVII